jgi:hypothetical protein
MNLNTLGIAVTAALLAGACATTTPGTTSPDPTGWNVQWRGVASDTLMKSEIGATMPLRPLAQAGNMYALGPVSGIKGEVAMWDSDPVMGMVVNGKPAIVRNIDAYASWLIWSQVKSWKAVAMPNRALSYAEINDVVSELAAANGITDPNKPLPFLMRGTIETASAHIVNYQDDGKPMTKEKVGILKTRFSLSNEPVEVLGFRSSRHSTNPGNIHMHARTANAIYHIDEVRIAAGATLYLPER